MTQAPPGPPRHDPLGPSPSPKPSFADQQRETRLSTWRLTRLPLVALLLWFFVAQVVLGRPAVFLDRVNLFLHEGGHFVFRIFGTMTMHIIGGTFTQLAFPAAFGLYFWFARRDVFATVVMVFWFGQNLLGVARYMYDAVDMALPLVGGDVHDFNYLFSHYGGLDRAVPTAHFTRGLGVVLELASLLVLGKLAWAPTDEQLEGDHRATFSDS